METMHWKNGGIGATFHSSSGVIGAAVVFMGTLDKTGAEGFGLC